MGKWYIHNPIKACTLQPKFFARPKFTHVVKIGSTESLTQEKKFCRINIMPINVGAKNSGSTVHNYVSAIASKHWYNYFNVHTTNLHVHVPCCVTSMYHVFSTCSVYQKPSGIWGSSQFQIGTVTVRFLKYFIDANLEDVGDSGARLVESRELCCGGGREDKGGEKDLRTG